MARYQPQLGAQGWQMLRGEVPGDGECGCMFAQESAPTGVGLRLEGKRGDGKRVRTSTNEPCSSANPVMANDEFEAIHGSPESRDMHFRPGTALPANVA